MAILPHVDADAATTITTMDADVDADVVAVVDVRLLQITADAVAKTITAVAADVAAS